MHIKLLLPLLLAAVPVAAQARLPLTPTGPEARFPVPVRAVATDHPLFNRISVDPVAGMPRRVGSWLHPITNPAEFDAALQQTFRDTAMLAGPGTAPRARLSVTWREIDAPVRIGAGSRASVVIAYELRRIDTGATIFQREIRTASSSRGGDASERLKANARAAILANIASVTLCLQRAAVGPAPADCAINVEGRMSRGRR
ncbi:MAG TPA: hypothetical protein VEW71_03220 [Allosphingosinicella sp.]|nr:hypothetical protein [Allosphingosinicella sp.]